MAHIKKINIIIADDNLVFLEGLRFLISTRSELIVIEESRNGFELMNSKNLNNADLLLIDIEMPVKNGIEAAKHINNHYRDLPMIAMTMHHENVFLNDILGAGFKGYIYKPDLSKVLFDRITKVLNKEFVFPDNLNIY